MDKLVRELWHHSLRLLNIDGRIPQACPSSEKMVVTEEVAMMMLVVEVEVQEVYFHLVC